MKGKVQIIKSNTLGMFDLLKGVAMLLIVFVHNRSLYPELIFNRVTSFSDDGTISVLAFINNISIIGRVVFSTLFIGFLAFMPTLLIIAGYGFRKRGVRKSWQLYSKELLKPYFLTVIAVTIFNFLLHYAMFRWIPGALGETAKVFLGMMYGVTQTREFGNLTIFANGPVWYLLTMFWALVVYNIIANYVDEKYITLISVGVSVVGWLLSYWKYTPFCLSQGLVAVVYVHIGHLLKKNKVLTSEFGLKEIVLYFLLVVIPNIVMLSFGMVTEMADNVYSLGPVSYIENGLLGIGLLFVFLKLNVFRGTITKMIRTIGRYSLYVMCVHTVEMIAIPWYVLAEKFDDEIIGFIVILVARAVLITLGCFFVLHMNGLINKVRSTKGGVNT